MVGRMTNDEVSNNDPETPTYDLLGGNDFFSLEDDLSSNESDEDEEVEVEVDDEIRLPSNEVLSHINTSDDHDIPYFRTLDNEEDVYMSTRESEMSYAGGWSNDSNSELKKGLYFGSKAKLIYGVSVWSIRNNKVFKTVESTRSLWNVKCVMDDTGK